MKRRHVVTTSRDRPDPFVSWGVVPPENHIGRYALSGRVARHNGLAGHGESGFPRAGTRTRESVCRAAVPWIASMLVHGWPVVEVEGIAH